MSTRMSQKVKLTKYEIRAIILKHYGLVVHAIKPYRGIPKVMTDQGAYGFKNAEEFPDLPLVQICLDTIRRRGFPFIPQLVPTLTGETNLAYAGQNYYLERWVEGQELPKEKHHEDALGKVLAQFHRASESLTLSEDSIRHRYGKRAAFLEECSHAMDNWVQYGKSFHEYDRQALDYLQYRCRMAYAYIADVPARHDTLLAAVCHGSLHHENILIDDKDDIWLIDFESLVYAERVYDLAQLVHYYADPHQWNPDVIGRILTSYEMEHQTPLSPDEYRYFLSYLAFPRRLANSMLQYFHNQPASKKRYTKLISVIEQEWPKERYLRSFSL